MTETSISVLFINASSNAYKLSALTTNNPLQVIRQVRVPARLSLQSPVILFVISIGDIERFKMAPYCPATGLPLIFKTTSIPFCIISSILLFWQGR
jgi:hypothetical protein